MAIGHKAVAAQRGVTKTKYAIFKAFYWHKCFSDVEDLVKTCDKCQKVGEPQHKKKAPLNILPVITENFRKINNEGSGPLPMTPSGNKYIIIALCMASRYPDAIPVANLCSTTVVNALLQIFSRMEFPRELQTDQGTSFRDALTTEFLERFGVKVVIEVMFIIHKLQMLDHLEDNIRRVIADIRPQMLGKVIENWTSRLDYIRTSHGSQMPEIIFKM
ncbi:retrovirus-related Pol polyprotein from transposon 412 [Trichonephila clavipes]|nr:retrovirus-related Pol polyprotein from transposon 412 [Trichonephila clavipes]